MKSVINSQWFHVILLLTIIGEFFLPWILGRYYTGYNSKMMVMSALGSLKSPVRLIYNMWLIWLGGFLTFTACAYFAAIKTKFPVLSVLIALSIGIFAVGAGLLSGIFSVNESKDMVTMSSRIHGFGAAIGFMALLFFPLLNGICSFKQKDIVFGVVSIISFILALVFLPALLWGIRSNFKIQF